VCDRRPHGLIQLDQVRPSRAGACPSKSARWWRCEKPSESERPISQWSQQSSAELSIGLCAGQTAGVIDWRINEIAQIVEPDEAQRAVLEELKTAMTKAVDLLKAGCPTDLPSTPTGRIEAMRMCALPPCWRPCAPCARRSPNSMTC
jgi:hypothetical protein